MKVTHEKPDILRIIYRQEPDDPDYGSCLWAIFDFDPGRGMLNIQSDCGNYAYRWPERGTMFLTLFHDMSEDYLLGKLCGKPGDFDQESTIAGIREYMDDMEISDNKKVKALKELVFILNEYDLSDQPEIAMFLVDEWNNDNYLEIDCAWELVRTEYNESEKRIVRIFREHVRPALQEAIADGGMYGTENED